MSHGYERKVTSAKPSHGLGEETKVRKGYDSVPGAKVFLVDATPSDQAPLLLACEVRVLETVGRAI
jgi:hypothetical protein